MIASTFRLKRAAWGIEWMSSSLRSAANPPKQLNKMWVASVLWQIFLFLFFLEEKNVVNWQADSPFHISINSQQNMERNCLLISDHRMKILGGGLLSFKHKIYFIDFISNSSIKLIIYTLGTLALLNLFSHTLVIRCCRVCKAACRVPCWAH